MQGIGLDSVSGPVGIYQVTAETASMGLLPFLSLLALFSLNIGIFNLLPIPVLDGGRIVIVVLEKLFRRKLKESVLNVIMLEFCAGHRTDAVCDLRAIVSAGCFDRVELQRSCQRCFAVFLDIKEEELWNFAYCAIF
ncbi:MAG: site-2 protease family protein [Merdibacter sp.]